MIALLIAMQVAYAEEPVQAPNEAAQAVVAALTDKAAEKADSKEDSRAEKPNRKPLVFDEPIGPGLAEARMLPEPVEDPAFERLMGEQPSLEAPPAAATSGTMLGTLAPFGLAIAGAVGFFLLRKGQGGIPGLLSNNAEQPMNVVSRTSLGGSAGLVLIDVKMPDGGTRRLLVGTGAGAPNLVADLGDDAAPYVDDGVPEPVHEPARLAPSKLPAPRTIPHQAADEEIEIPPPANSEPTSLGSPLQRFVAASRLLAGQAPGVEAVDEDRESRRKAARSLLDDVLATRGEPPLTKGGRS